MSYSEPTSDLHRTDAAPGDQRLDRAEIAEGIKSYLVGLGLSILLTVMSFFISGTTLVWGPSIPVALVVLAIAQMGVHLVFFLHITTAPDNVNNVLALAFGVLIVLLVLAGSLWIMAHLNYNMKPMDQMMQMQLERGPGARAITARGVVGPATAASVGARVSGVTQAIHCNASMRVKAGQLCAKIDPCPDQHVSIRLSALANHKGPAPSANRAHSNPSRRSPTAPSHSVHKPTRRFGVAMAVKLL